MFKDGFLIYDTMILQYFYEFFGKLETFIYVLGIKKKLKSLKRINEINIYEKILRRVLGNLGKVKKIKKEFKSKSDLENKHFFYLQLFCR